MNLFGRILILVVFTSVLSFGLVTIVNSASTDSGFSQGKPPQGFQQDQTGSSSQTDTSRPPKREGGSEVEGGTGFAFIEIGRNLGIIALITLVVVLIQKGITKIVPRKQEATR